MEVTKEIKEKIEKISKLRDVSEEELLKSFEEICNTKNLQEYPEDQRIPYAGRILWTRYMSKEPTKKYTVIPYGVEERRVLRSGESQSKIYAMVQEEGGKLEMKEINCKGKDVEIPSTLELYNIYQGVELTDRLYFLELSTNAKFNSAKPLSMDDLEFLKRYCKFPTLVNLREVATHPSKTEGGYVVRDDAYIIQGISIRFKKRGKRADGSEYSLYVIKDDSLGIENEVIKVRGKGEDNEEIIQEVVIPTSITVWVPSRFVLYDKESELGFVGTIGINKKDKTPSMNAYYVYPAGIVREIGGE